MDNLQQEAMILMEDLSPVAIDITLNVLSAIAILIVGLAVARWAANATRKALSRPRFDATLALIFSAVVRYFIIIIVLVAILSQFGVQTASIIAALGAAGLAIGLALQGTLSNIAAGVMLLFLRPFQVGDYIDAEGIGGTVDELGLFTTQMRTADGIYVSVPNSSIWNRQIMNYSRLPTRRIVIPVGISYSDDIDQAQQILMELMQGDSRVLQSPEPQVLVTGLGDSSVDLSVRCWSSTGDYWGLLWDLNKASKELLEHAGITIPFPQRELRIVSDSTKEASRAS
ncbi:MAG: mechanosensitive ion channel domain-containing protein [Rhodovibrionaceae bacterium]